MIITCLGMEHNIQFIHCDCEPLPLTMVRANLWPATPQHPRYAFTFNLLDWAEALLLESHVALKDFCNSLYFRCPYPVTKVLCMSINKTIWYLYLILEEGRVL